MILWVLMFQIAYGGPYIGYATEELCLKAYSSEKIKEVGECVPFAADIIQVQPQRDYKRNG
jgi:hypothetical protein